MWRFRRLLVLATALVAVAVAGPGAAAAPVDVTTSSGSVTNAGTQSVTVTTSAPAVATGTYTQQITQRWDPERFRVTDPTTIVLPVGWSASYSTDGTTFSGTTPATQSAWNAVRAIRAEGPLTSRGTSGGRQVAERAASITPPVGADFQGSSGGDGWDVFFDEHDRVFNIFHHAATGRLDCHTRSGALCTGFSTPFTFPTGHGTPHQSAGWVDPGTDLLWYPVATSTDTGFGCVDVSYAAGYASGQPRNCAPARYALGPSTGAIGNVFDRVDGLAQVGTKLYTRSSETGRLLCLDISSSPAVACPGQPYDVGAVDQPVEFGDYVYFPSGAGIGCWNPATNTWCAGWPVSGTPSRPSVAVALSGLSYQDSHDHLYELPDETGSVIGICVESGATRACVQPMGAASPGAALTGTYDFPGGLTTTGIAWHNKEPVRSGTRLYWVDGNYNTNEQLRCWDAAANSGAGAACSGWPKTENRGYALTVDPDNGACVWTNGDPGAIKVWDYDGSSGCNTPPPIVNFTPDLVVPRMACAGGSAIQAWDAFTLSAPAASTYATAKLTVLDSNGAPIAGWIDQPITVVGGVRAVDLSGLSVAATGTAPTFRITYTARTTSGGASNATGAAVTAVGEVPQLCIGLQAHATPCPAVSAPARHAGALAAVPTTLTGSGQAVPTSGPTEVFDAAERPVSFAAAADATCLGTISGAATMAHDASPAAGAQVLLRDGSGAVIAETTADGAGGYVFDRLIAGSGYRVSFGDYARGTADVTTVASATTSRTVTAGAATTVNGQYARVRTDDLEGTAVYGQPVTLTPAPTASDGTIGYAAFDRSATCVVDPADDACRQTVVIAGEGVWSVEPATGVITFTPQAGFTGTATQRRYRVTETSSGLEVHGRLDATIGQPPATAAADPVPGTRAPDPARIRLSLTPDRRVVRSGDRVTVRLAVVNTGDVTARAVRVCMRIPAGFALAGQTGGRMAAGSLCFAVGNLTGDARRARTVTLVATASRAADIRFEGTATAVNAVRSNARATALPVRVRPAANGNADGVTG